MKGRKTNWTAEMVDKLSAEFPNRFSRDIGNDLGISIRTVIRKAREMGLEKENDFLEKNREEISNRAQIARPENPTKGLKGWSVPNSEAYRFKKGNVPPNKNNPELVERSARTRNETIRKERMRIKYNLPQQTNLNLNPYSYPKTKFN